MLPTKGKTDVGLMKGKPRGAGLAGESGGVTGRRKLRGGREADHLEVRRDVGLEQEGEGRREGARNLARGSRAETPHPPLEGSSPFLLRPFPPLPFPSLLSLNPRD